MEGGKAREREKTDTRGKRRKGGMTGLLSARLHVYLGKLLCIVVLIDRCVVVPITPWSTLIIEV